MGAIDTSYTFTATDVITSTKMNNILDQSTITATAVFNSTLSIASGKLLVATGGITSNELAVSAVTTTAITDLSVTTGKIADLAITTGKLNDLSVTTGKIADSGVTTVKIADANVTAAKLSGAQTGTAPIFGARAWVVFDMTRNASGGSDLANTDRFIYSNGNVASVTKIGSGRFQVNFTTAMPNENYAYFGSGRTGSGDNSGDITIGRSNSTGSADGAKTTSSIRLDVVDAGAAFLDSPEVCVSIIG